MLCLCLLQASLVHARDPADSQPSIQAADRANPVATRPAAATPPAVRPTGIPENTRPSPARQPIANEIAVHRVAVECLFPGQAFTLPIPRDGLQPSSSWSLDTDQGPVPLIILERSGAQTMVMIPADTSISPRRVYAVFEHTPHALSPRRTDWHVRTCAFNRENLAAPPAVHDHADELLVMLNASELPQARNILRQQGYSIIREHELASLERSLLVVATDAHRIDQMIEALQAAIPSAEIDRNDYYRTSADPRLYAAAHINWTAALICRHEPRKVTRIGLIDSEIDLHHPALNPRNIVQVLFDTHKPSMDKRHGTALAVILAGEGRSAHLQGLLPGAQILSAAVMQQAGDASVATTEGISRALDWLAGEQVRLINISLAGPRPNRVLGALFDISVRGGALIFAAAGNGGPDAPPAYPAALPGVFAITAIDVADHIYAFANLGNYVDFAAPGVDIWTAGSSGSANDAGEYRSGTSFAAPHALAVAAVLLDINPTMSRALVYEMMRRHSLDLGESGRDTTFGWGRLQVPSDLCSPPLQ